jgi:outer membrane protein TolC
MGKHTQIGSTFTATLLQPLLRNAGRQVRLEGLTQAERDVLYAVRNYARFRKQFWAGIAVENGGYLDLLLALQTLRNQQSNLKRQEETYRLYNELFRGGRASVVELDQFFQSLQAARGAVVNAEIGLQSALDNFKLRLGIPPRIPAELDDSLLNQFVLTDPALDALRDDIEEFQRERFKELGQPPAVAELRNHFAGLRKLAGRVAPAVDKAAADLLKWERKLDQPDRPGDNDEVRERARAAYEGLKNTLPEVRRDLAKIMTAIDRHRDAVTPATREAGWEAILDDAKVVLAQLDAVLAVQTQARIYLIELPEVDAEEAPALAFAKANRLDLMNQLGTVTDAWRKVTVAANQLRSDLNVVATANLGTDPDTKNPFNFASEASKYTAAVQFDGPLNRQAERNVYRASLVTYQRARRGYMALSDTIEFQVREDLRQLRRLRVTFEVSRQQLLSAARQFENARLTLLSPQRRGANDTTTLNLLQALSTLLGARNGLAASYINYEQQRVQLLIDLEALQLDPRGFPTNAAPRTPDAADRPGDLPEPRPLPDLQGAVRLGRPNGVGP